MKQDVVLFADLLNFLPIALGRYNYSATSRDRFEAKRTNCVWPFAQDHLFNCFSRLHTIAVARVFVLRTILEAMRHPHEPGRKRPVLCVALILTTCGHGRDGGTVIIALPIQDLVLLAAVVLVADLADHLERFLIGLRA